MTTTTEVARDFTAEQRKKLAKEGKAMSDGSFPIVTVEDLKNAIGLAGNAKNSAAAKRHIRKRAKALGKTDLIPDSWGKESADFSHDAIIERMRAYYGRITAHAEGLTGREFDQALHAAVVDALPGDSYAWVRDHGEGWVVYAVESGGERDWTVTTYRQNFTVEDGRVMLTGAREKVREAVSYVPELARGAPQIGRAFVMEVGGRTMLTGPARALLPETAEGHLRINPEFMYLQGALVGAEQANANGAFWATEDLELGEPTVANSPLNWLHDERHIIGAIHDSQLVMPSKQLAAAGITQPYIAVGAAVWRFIYRDEAEIIQRSSDAGESYLSMECVSKVVACVDHGCGEWAYRDYVQKADGVCEHLRERSGARRFKEPTFLGAGVIVPPIKPGWPDAHMQVMEVAREKAAAAYQSAGQPDIPASTWELMVAQVIALAGLRD